MFEIGLLLLMGIASGVFGAMLGIGGGTFVVPLLVIFLHFPIHQAVAISLISIIATSSSVASANVYNKITNMKLGITLELATTLGAIAGSFIGILLNGNIIALIFSFVMAFIAYFMYNHKENAANNTKIQAKSVYAGSYFDYALNKNVDYDVKNLGAGMLISTFAGAFSGMLGIGGGVLKVPAMNAFCKVPIRVAAATSNFMIGVTAAAGAFIYFGKGYIGNPLFVAIIVIGVVFGSKLSMPIMRKIPPSRIKNIFILFLVYLAIEMFIKGVK
ncbi:putative membrane protein [Desulfurella amilsii]|uniref:Probable membrane transporter protein n=1 Tax=Desulfurella amilsii TaxID=1562698 RepID=A0A1X4XXG9_9BACT|nr:sulfite exporter TauE/SafE family protein [Desulfurella amilsii]OSS42208.1 putative membrane protein [Desulfurella amilsii]